jgi:hypothetical protein
MDRGHLGTLLPYYDLTIAESMADIQTVKHNLVKISPQFQPAAQRFCRASIRLRKMNNL